MQTEQAQEHLTRLATVLTERGGVTATFTKAATPTLRVENERTPRLGDRVCCTGDGSFVWASGNPIAPVDDVDAAVQQITYVLRDVAEETS